MYEYDEECLKTFILNQGQLFDEPVAETLEEAEAFLEDCIYNITNICFAHVNVLSETHINLRFLRNNPIQTKGILQENSSCVLSFRAEKDMLLWW